MNAFRVTYTDGTSYETNANGTREEFEAYLMQFGGVITDENPETGEETRRYIAKVEQVTQKHTLVKIVSADFANTEPLTTFSRKQHYPPANDGFMRPHTITRAYYGSKASRRRLNRLVDVLNWKITWEGCMSTATAPGHETA